MDERNRPRGDRSGALRDLLLISLAALGLFWLGHVTNGYERTVHLIDEYFPGHRDDILLGVAVAALMFLLFAILRWRSARSQRKARTAAERYYRKLVEEMPVVTYVVDTLHDQRAGSRWIAPGIEQLLGCTADEWLEDPQSWSKRLHPDDRDAVLAETERTDRTGEPFRVEYRLIAKDARVVWVHDEAVVLERGRRGRSVWQGMLLDITPRKQAEERLREVDTRYRSLVETIPAVTYVDRVDEASSTIYVSPQVYEMLGYTAEQWTGDPMLWLRMIHPSERDRVRAASERHNETGELFDQEYKIRAADGRWVAVRDQATIVRGDDGQPLFSQGVMTDVTDRKLAEEALRESEHREREAAERLRALDEMKNTFLAAVSHELRSPLTSILGLAVTLEHQDLPDADRRDLLERLASNARKLDGLLRDLLDIDRLSRGIVTPQYKPTELGTLVRRTVENLDVPPNRRVVVNERAVTVQADSPKVERIVENLLANAFRHAGPDATVWVRIGDQDGGALLVVEDDGPGVPRHLQKAIFEPFRQGPTASAHSPGTGIGLSLVAMFAELHGGTAWVEDREGGGASFRVFLPQAPPFGTGETGGDAADGGPSDLDTASSG
jgi:PAS domain S-box-containing protein